MSGGAHGGIGYRVSGFKYQVSSFKFQVSGFRFQVTILEQEFSWNRYNYTTHPCPNPLLTINPTLSSLIKLTSLYREYTNHFFLTQRFFKSVLLLRVWHERPNSPGRMVRLSARGAEVGALRLQIALQNFHATL